MVADQAQLASSGSVVIERDSRVVKAMLALKSGGDFTTKRILRGVDIVEAEINSAIIRGLLHGKRFNLINLDYLGIISTMQVNQPFSLCSNSGFSRIPRSSW